LTRISPVEEPYPPPVAALFDSFLPGGLPPLRVARTLARNVPMARALSNWHWYELSDALTLDLRAREIVIQRACALCDCEYQWGLHVAVFAERAGLGPDQIRSLVHGCAADDCWTAQRDRLLIELADQLHIRSDVDDGLWAGLAESFTEEQLLDLLALCGWVHTISFLTRGARVEPEPGLPGFADVLEPAEPPEHREHGRSPRQRSDTGTST
jgi:alkylhydroperoxidase family enzyme